MQMSILTIVLMGSNAAVNLINWSISRTKPDSAIFDELYKYMAEHVRYPAVARQSNLTGKVFAVFSVNTNGDLTYLKIV